jgi:hypothetical protein
VALDALDQGLLHRVDAQAAAVAKHDDAPLEVGQLRGCMAAGRPEVCGFERTIVAAGGLVCTLSVKFVVQPKLAAMAEDPNESVRSCRAMLN